MALEQPTFEDDFSDPALGRFYHLRPGVGEVRRQRGGLHYRIVHGMDGPPSALDCLTIDSLGRPQPPTAQVHLTFESTAWTAEVAIEYDFETKSNGRVANLWVVFGEASTRTERSLQISRSADLQPESHRLSVVLHQNQREPLSKELSGRPQRLNWFRISRDGEQLRAQWSEDGTTFVTILEWTDATARALQSVLINSSSFAGGASFIVKSLKLTGAHPREIPPVPIAFTLIGKETDLAEVDAETIVAAAAAGRNVHLIRCVVKGPLDLSKALLSHSDLSAHLCEFPDTIYAPTPMSAKGFISFTGCEFATIGLSNVQFRKPFEAVGCHFRDDTRFIETRFEAGADFSLSTFDRKPFFRIAQCAGSLSMYYCNFLAGADCSAMVINGDLSIADIRLAGGTLTFRQAKIGGATRLMVTLQRDPQEFNGTLDFSNAALGELVVSSGDRNNQSEYTGPPRWDLGSDVFLRDAQVGKLILHNVRFLKTLDLTGARDTIKSVEKRTVQVAQLVGSWPVSTDFYSCFISYSSKDEQFARNLHAQLTESGVKCWFAPKDLKPGEFFRQRIDDEIHEHDKLLLVLSEESVRSGWVREEVEACFDRENREGSTVLFPLRLDNAVMHTKAAWAASIRRQRHIENFLGWSEPETYQTAFQRLLDNLRTGK